MHTLPTVAAYMVLSLAFVAGAVLAGFAIMIWGQTLHKRAVRRHQVEDYTHKTGMSELATARARLTSEPGDAVTIVNADTFKLPWERANVALCRHGKTHGRCSLYDCPHYSYRTF